jgi:hypothetical protein
VLHEIFCHMRATAIHSDTIEEAMHQWYAHDKTITTQKEILELLKETYRNYDAERKVA